MKGTPTILRRAAHILTAYHRRNSALAVCSCGWRASVFRRSRRARLRHLLCLLRGHRLDEVGHAYLGPAGYGEDGPDTLFSSNRQCERCYRVITIRRLLVDEFGPGFGPELPEADGALPADGEERESPAQPAG